jgi:hypothetical protein
VDQLESTGVYWKPIWNLLEFALDLINAEHIKKVPGRITGAKDSEWVAGWLQHGSVRGSLRAAGTDALPCRIVRGQGSGQPHVLEHANIKLASIASEYWEPRGGPFWRRWSAASRMQEKHSHC